VVNEKMKAYILTSMTEYFWAVIEECFVNIKKEPGISVFM
jgi:hypothetical protein